MESSDSSSSDSDTALPIFNCGPGQPVPKHLFPSSTSTEISVKKRPKRQYSHRKKDARRNITAAPGPSAKISMDVETSENDELGKETWQPSSNHHDLDDDDIVPVPDIGNTDFFY